MTNAQESKAPAGWYPVSPGSTQLRWWDGNVWTDHVNDTTAAAAAVIARPVIPQAPEGTKNSTVWGWLIAASPVLSMLLLIPLSAWLNSVFGAIGSIASTETAPSPGAIISAEFSPLYFVVIACGFLIEAIYVVLAFLDWRALKRAGVPQPFHWAWSFFTFVSLGVFVYIIGRSVILKRRTGGGMAPLWLFIALEVLSFIAGIVVVVIFLVGFTNQIGDYASLTGNAV